MDVQHRAHPLHGGLSRRELATGRRDGPERNLADLERHARDFAEHKGFTFTVLDPADEVIGCVYLYPPNTDEHDVSVQSWVRASHAQLDAPLTDAVAEWIAAEWPWERPDRYGR